MPPPAALARSINCRYLRTVKGFEWRHSSASMAGTEVWERENQGGADCPGGMNDEDAQCRNVLVDRQKQAWVEAVWWRIRRRAE